MIFSLAPTLGFDAQWLLGIGVVVAMVISWISNILKEQKQSRKTGQTVASQRQSVPQEDRADQADLTEEELAGRRRAQLQEMARRRSVEDRPRPDRGTEPANLTMAERVRRARAKAEYQRRAEGLGVSQTSSSTSPTRPQPPSPPIPIQGGARSEKHGDDIAHRQLLRPRLESAVANRGLIPRVGSQNLGSGVTVVDGSGRPEDGRVHRNVPDARPVVEAPTRAFLTGKSLRDAVVLKEILDRPLGLRDL